MKKLLDEFKTFALRGNVIDLAVGIVIGGAFGALVKGVVDGIINPVLSLVKGTAVHPMHSLWEGLLAFGGGVVNFVILAAVVFFVFVKPMNKLKAILLHEEANKPTEPLAPTAEQQLLTEIRDLLKEKQ